MADGHSFDDEETDLVKKSTEDGRILGDQDIRYSVLNGGQDGGVKKDNSDGEAPLSPWDLGGLNSGSVQGRGFNSDTRSSSATSSEPSHASSETSSRTPIGALFDSSNQGSFSNRVTSQRSIVTSSMSTTSVGGGSEWGKELWESLQIGSLPPRSNPTKKGQINHDISHRPNNKFSIIPTTTTSPSFTQPEKIYVNDVDGRQNYSDHSLLNSGHPVGTRADDSIQLEPELGLQFPLGDPIVGSAVQDLDISLSSPTTERSYLLKTNPSQAYYPNNLLKISSTTPTQPPQDRLPSTVTRIDTTTLPASESTTLRESTLTPLIGFPPSPTPQGTTISDSRSPPRYNDGPLQFWERVKV